MNNEQCTIFAQTERSSQIHLDDAEVQPKITQKRSGCVMNNVQWRKEKLGEVVVPLKGKLTEQSDCFHDDWKSLINTTAIDGESKTWANPINAVLCEPDDVLMLWDGERSGLVITGKQGVVGSTFARLRPNHELDGKYLYFFLLNNFEWIQNRRTGTGVPHAPKDLMRIFQISYPESLPAQRRIAAILASADKVIAATQKTIAKYKQIKQGMMEDLLKPKEGWKMVKLGECCEDIFSGKNTTRQDFGKYVVYGSTGPIGYSEDYEYDFDAVLVARVGANAGLVNKVSGLYDVSDNTLIIKILRNVDLNYMHYLLIRLNLNQFIFGSGQPLVTAGLLKKIEIPIPYKNNIPDLTEQHRIAAILSGIDAKIAAEEKVLQKYEKVKKGLMEKLLNEQCKRKETKKTEI